MRVLKVYGKAKVYGEAHICHSEEEMRLRDWTRKVVRYNYTTGLGLPFCSYAERATTKIILAATSR